MKKLLRRLIENKNTLLLFSIAILIVPFLLIRNQNPYGDEYVHLEQIKYFIEGKLQIVRGISKLPGYFLLIAFFSHTFNINELGGFRTISFLISILSILVYYKLVKKLDKKNAIITTIQYILLPISFPLLFLLYTESLSTLLVILSLYLAIRKRYLLASVVSLLSVGIRQTNIIWFLFIFILSYVLSNGYDLNLKKIKSYFSKSYFFLISISLFLVFIFLNKGIAIKDQLTTPSFQIHMGNVFWSLFLFLILFIPVNLVNLGKVKKLILKQNAVLIPAISFILISLFIFPNLNPMNSDPIHLKNNFLLFFHSGLLPKLTYLILLTYSVLSISSVKLVKKHYYLSYIFMFLSLVPFWLVVSRYVIIPFLLFNTFRKKESPIIEYLIVLIFLSLSLILFEGVLSRKFLL